LASGASLAVLKYTYVLKKIKAKNYERSLFDRHTFRRQCGFIFPSWCRFVAYKYNRISSRLETTGQTCGALNILYPTAVLNSTFRTAAG
jgi:hypothetical protein